MNNQKTMIRIFKITHSVFVFFFIVFHCSANKNYKNKKQQTQFENRKNTYLNEITNNTNKNAKIAWQGTNKKAQ